jgi:diaminopimelate decarboxylase
LSDQLKTANLRHVRAQRLSQLAVQTPHLEYDGGVALSALAAMRTGLARSGVEARIHLALKSCYCRPLLELMAEAEVAAEVMSELEYDFARSCGFAASETIVNGMGRGVSGLRRPLAEGATVIADSDGDFQALRQLAEAQPERQVKLGVRVRLRSGTAGGTEYSGSSSKLGIERDSPMLKALIEWAQATPQVSLEMAHAHVATNELTAGVHSTAIEELHGVVSSLEAEWPDLHFRRVNFGGGFGTFLDDELERAAEMFAAVGASFQEWFPGRTLVLEPGRYLTNRAGSMVGTVLDVKRDRERTIVISDIGTNVLIPIATARYTLEYPPAPQGGVRLMLADGITSPDNVVISEERVSGVPRVGDRVVVGSCGAYSHVFAHVWAYDVPTVSYLDPSGERTHLITAADVAARRAVELAL